MISTQKAAAGIIRGLENRVCEEKYKPGNG